MYEEGFRAGSFLVSGKGEELANVNWGGWRFAVLRAFDVMKTQPEMT